MSRGAMDAVFGRIVDEVDGDLELQGALKIKRPLKATPVPDDGVIEISYAGEVGVGDVAGPGSAVDGHLPAFDGTTGKLLEDSGIAAANVEFAARPTVSYTTTANTPVLADSRKHILTSNASANTLTIPPNSSVAYPAATWLVGTNIGAGTMTLTAGAGVTLGGLAFSVPTGATWFAKKTATDTWYCAVINAGGGTSSGGGGMGFRYTYSATTTDADPGAGTLRISSASYATAGTFTVYIDLAEYGGTDVTAWIDSLDDYNGAIKGVLRLQSLSDPTKWVEYTITAWTTATGYRKLTAVYKDGPGGLLTTAGDTFASFDYATSITGDGSTVTVTAAGVASIPNNGVGNAQLATNAVTTTKIADSNVTTAKLSGLNIVDIPPVDAATTGNITLSGAQTIDGVTLTNGVSRVLAWQQSTASQNGIYVYNSGGAWTRATDQDSSSDFRPGVPFKIAGGTLHGGKTACLSTTAAITVGSTSVAYELSNAPPVDPTDNGKIYGASSGQVVLYTCTGGLATSGTNIQLAAQLLALATPGGALKPIRQNAANNALEFFSPPGPVIGTDLTNASVTKTIADGSQFTLPAGTLASSAKTLTLGTGGTPEIDEVIEVIVYSQSQDFILANSVGATIYTVTAGTKRVLHAAWGGAQWQAAGKIRLA